MLLALYEVNGSGGALCLNRFLAKLATPRKLVRETSLRNLSVYDLRMTQQIVTAVGSEAGSKNAVKHVIE